MTTSNPTQTQSRDGSGARGYSPHLEPDPGSAQSPAAVPDPIHGQGAKAPAPAGFSPNAADPGLSVPAGLGTGLTGPWPPGGEDPRLNLGLGEIEAAWSLALNLADQYPALPLPQDDFGAGPIPSAPSGGAGQTPPASSAESSFYPPNPAVGSYPGTPAPTVEGNLPQNPAGGLGLPGPYPAPNQPLSPLITAAAPYDLGGLAPILQALGAPLADAPDLGSVNEAAAETQALPFWLGEPTGPIPWASDWTPGPVPAPASLSPAWPSVAAAEPAYYSPTLVPDQGTAAGPPALPGGPAAPLGAIPALAPPPYVGPFSVEKIRGDFPILATKVDGGLPLIWFDNAATTQKPQAVIDRLARYYSEENSNVHRGAHYLATKATEAYEEARRKVAGFIGAPGPENVVFVRGTTEGVNLVAQAFVGPRLGPGDEIVLTELEHHANIVPWQILAHSKGAYIKVLPIDDRGQLILSALPGLISPRTRVISLAHVSNALGTVTELTEVISIAKSLGIPVVVDAAQSIAHVPLDVKALGADFLVFSGHKIYAPTGIGVVYGTSQALDEAQPWQGGGNMITDVTFEKTLYREPPVKFEAGTANIAGAVGLGAALDYVGGLGLDRIALYEESLLHYLAERLSSIPGLTIIGTPAKRAGVVSFVLANRTVAEVGAHLAKYGVALRAGHHCAQPAVRHFGLEGTVRPSPAFYNTPAEIDSFIEILGLLV